MQTRKLWALTRFILTTAALFAAWLLFTASFDPFSLISGLAGSLAVSFMTYRVFIAEHEASLHSFLPRPLPIIRFFLVLLFNLYASSIKMLVTIVRGNPTPRIVHFKTRLRSDLARMALCNSITFTPGTITLDLNDDHLTVHWFFCTTAHSKAAGEAVKGGLEKHLGRVWS